MTEDPGRRRPRRWFPAEPTRPLAVEGGLKARSTRGAIGQTWWSGRFIAVLEAIGRRRPAGTRPQLRPHAAR